ncbi:hypothetical protein CEP54_006046 [Fusarium duplospermum]|uniref:Uncharacterized protein n=1 Tax=Fusarium duplospermum TaxID=1325734 RepID=A0A428Q8V7_9HYPO|nr:hypothetical protein CEP54_006046 [Fusarium duplospermum]
MEKKLGYTADSMTLPDKERFYSDLKPMSNDTLKQFLREYQELTRRDHGICHLEKSGQDLVIKGDGCSVVITQTDRTGFYRYAVDIKYDRGFYLPLLLTEAEASLVLTAPKLPLIETSRGDSTFLNLPRELRENIYHFALPPRELGIKDIDAFERQCFPVAVGDPSGYFFQVGQEPAILGVNKQIRQEALPFAYRNTTFCLDDLDDAVKVLVAVGQIGRDNMTSLQFPWESKNEIQSTLEQSPHSSDVPLELPSLHVSRCIQLLKRCKRLEILRICLDQDIFKHVSTSKFLTDPGIEGLCGLRHLRRLEVVDLSDETLEEHPAVKQLYEKMKNTRVSDKAVLIDTESFYREALQRIEDQDRVDRDLARKALSFVFYAKRPLKLEELLHALGVEPGDKDLDRTALTEKHTLLSVTAGLLLVDQQTYNVQLVHPTLREYLEKKSSNHFLEHEASFALVCLTYLCFEPFRAGPCKTEEGLDQRMRQYALLSYASHHWGDHFARCRKQGNVDEILHFLESQESLASSVQVLYAPQHRRIGWHEEFPGNFSSLHAAAYWGLEDVLAAICQEGTEINSPDSRGMTALHLSSQRGFVGPVRLLLAQGADKNSTNDNGETALIWAARNGHGQVVRLLIASGADCMVEDNEVWTALHWAVINGYDELVKPLLEPHSGLGQDETQTTKALILAAEAGSSKTTEMLLRQAADIDWKDEEGSTALHWAVAAGHEQTSALLLKNKANANSRDNFDNTPLHWAIPYSGITRLLLEHGGNTDSANNTGQTPLHWSAQAGLEATTELLVQHGANSNAQDEHGVTPLHAAVLGGHEAVVNILLLNGANANVMDKDGWTPLHAAIVKQHGALQNQLAPKTQNKARFVDQMHKRMNDENERALLEEMAEKKSHGSTVVSGLRSAVNSGYRQRVLALLDGGADIDAQDPIGDCTALTHAAWIGRDDFVELLLENGADPNRREQHGRTALHIAVKHGYSGIVTTLVDHGADVDARVHSWTPLLLAARDWWFQVPDYLVKKGADVNAADYHGRTALHWAAHHGDKRLAQLLLQRGADVNARDRWGKTAFQWAVANWQVGMADLPEHAEAVVS